MKSCNKYPLETEVEADEFLVGGFDENKQEQSPEPKELVVLGIEKVMDKSGKVTIGRAYTKLLKMHPLKNYDHSLNRKLIRTAT